MARSKLGWDKKCQKCGKRKESTRHRSVYTKNYQGPCGDSFCYASCDSSSCRPINVTICDECTKEISK